MKLNKKLLFGLGVPAIGTIATIAAVSCGTVDPFPGQSSKDLAEVQNASNFTVKNFEATGGTTEQNNALDTFLKGTTGKPTITLKSGVDKVSGKIVTDDFDISTVSGSTYSFEIKNVIYSGADSAKLNVLVKVTQGPSTGYYVETIANPKGAYTASDATFAMSFGDPNNPRWINATNYMTEAAKINGYGGNTTNVGVQNNQNTNLLSDLDKGAAALIIGSIDGNSVGSTVDSAVSKGAQVIAYDRLITGTANYNWYVAFDNYLIGQIQGMYMMAHFFGLDTTGKTDWTKETLLAAVKGATRLTSEKGIILSAGAQTDNNAGLFLGGALDIIKEVMKIDPQVKIYNRDGANSTIQQLDTNWSNTTAATNFAAVYNSLTTEQKNSLAGVLAPNDGIALAIAATSEINSRANQKANGIYITAHDGNIEAIDQLKKGATDSSIGMTISKPDINLTKVAASLATVLVAFPKATPDQIYSMVRLANPTIEFTLEQGQYKVGAKVINTIMLVPRVVTPQNVSSLSN
ncbi:monosaccharide ABC transporter substrate-binding protein (CUT2 family) [Mycoplasma testudineum]|uniref:Monosaccharide ABC transporter substrate-binding protein (CUT2 family) n=1 Tax=Mycoplasma testudineum TaxID=244584 RepID=A0A4R6IH60_9MOLU|nr:substrate-binding domain-containing protein [Mycoplasma testudineum]OYD27054.1 hypothetical protein CG473_00165 [Mycoplasma testudineum]TDO21191.1 monosaccharide ABC transporter substrate-binding protein (CUT2 family) [Mycoplasma testudineum]